MNAVQSNIEEISFRVRDGLKLHARCYHAHNPTGRPVLCLPGLTRNGRDFHDLALHLSKRGANARDVYTLDYRGRGSSEWDTDWKNYTVPTEAQDVQDFLIMTGLTDVAIIGTSRGGLIAMVLSAIQPSLIGPVVLNDIGPVIETDGIIRIAGYVGLVPLPRDWNEAAKIVRDGNKRYFPRVSDEEWGRVARQWFNEKNGRPAPGYDPQLKYSLSVLDGPMPQLWPQFESLNRVPLLVLRGENTDILSEQTVLDMRRRHPTLETYTVKHQGHAPLLTDAPTQNRISGFLDACEQVTDNAHAASNQPDSIANRIAANNAA